MKNSIRRLISFAIALILLILTTSVLSGCYVIKSGRMHKIEGTYALTSYGGDVDRLAENGIQMFLVIREDGTGHYAYLDNDTEPYIADIRCRFINDTEDPDKYSYVEIDFGGAEYEKFAVFAQTFKVHKVFAEAIDAVKSVGLMKKLGMQLEGIQRSQTKDLQGNWADLYLYGLLADDWSKHE